MYNSYQDFFAILKDADPAILVLDDFRTTIISREDLILSKLEWAKDSGSEMQLRDVRNLLAANCDLDYLRRWAKDLSVKETLESLLADE